jgi:hypothetical protein
MGNKINDYTPYKIRKRITKTKDARSGALIYKRRNNRSYRVLIQYKTFEKSMKTDPNFLDNFINGFVVLISPNDYFVKNVTKESYFDVNLILGINSIVYYSSIEEVNKFPIPKDWKNVFEIYTDGSLEGSWTGDYALEISNAVPQRLSPICDNKIKDNKNLIKDFFAGLLAIEPEKYVTYRKKSPPAQAGLGNYDFDFADDATQSKVCNQILWMLLNTKTKDGDDYFEFIKNSEPTSKIWHTKDSSLLKKKGSWKADDYQKAYLKFSKKAENDALLDTEKLSELGVWDSVSNVPICPLCKYKIYLEDFFDSTPQDEGREVATNTSKEIVLMHIRALIPGELNHRPYNLGWGHSYCNRLQGNMSIDDTISKLRGIIKAWDLD